ncbi:MAG: hypothetical protein Kow00121_59330 [Elainellaceae cyanobacterium]
MTEINPLPDRDPEATPIPHERDPDPRPPQQVPDAPPVDPNIPAAPALFPPELDPATPDPKDPETR